MNNSTFHLSAGKKPVGILCICLCFCLLTGCEAFVRKFTRKTKKSNVPREEMVLVPEEYTGPQLSREELYRRHLLFWQSWHDELITALVRGTSHKKMLVCCVEAIKNLELLLPFFDESQQKGLERYIRELNALQEEIRRDPYGNKLSRHRYTAEHLKRDILRNFSYNKVKNFMI